MEYYNENLNQYDLVDDRIRPGLGLGRPGSGFGLSPGIGFGRPGLGLGRPGSGFGFSPGVGFGRPGFGLGRPFGYPFLTGLAAGALLRPPYPYYYPYPPYPYYYPVPTPYPYPYPYQGPNYNLPGFY